MTYIWLLYILVDVIGNYILIEKLHTRPNYLVLFIIRGTSAILHGILLDTQPSEWPELLVFQVTSFYLLFDILLNILRKKPLLYRGKNSGWLDKLPTPLYIALKVICLIGMIFVIY